MTEYVSRTMRQMLLANRDGRLTNDQWRELVTEPLTPLLILMIPGVFIAGPALGRLGGRGLIFIIGVIAVVFVLPLAFRAWRYSSRAVVVEHATLYTGANSMTRWLFWRPAVFYTAKGEPIRFKRRLAPLTILKPNTAYLVYFIDEPNAVLLSLAPDDHPDSVTWRPQINS